MNEENIDLVTSSEEIKKLVCVAFGENGRAVMIQQPTGQISITRSGLRIVSSIYSDADPKKPAQHILIDSARTLHETVGDGVKSFIILTSALLKHSVGLNNPVQVAKQLSDLHLKLSCFQTQCPELPLVNDHILKQHIISFETLVYTFFSTRFPTPINIILVPLLCKWIISNTCSNKYPYSFQNLEKLLKNFSLLCQFEEGDSRPVAESFVQCGFQVHRRVFNLPQEGLRKVKILMLDDSEANGKGCFDDMDVKSEVERFIAEIKTEHESIKNEKILLITSAILSDLILFQLKCLGVAVLQGILPEELIFISLLLFNLGKEAEVNVKSIIDCGEHYTRLDFSNVHQLFLRAPTRELAAEYACTCRDALKVCLVATSHAVQTNGLPYVVKAGGNFEETLKSKLLQLSHKRIRDPFLCGVSNRAELLAWHKQHYEGKKLTEEDQNMVNLSSENKNQSHFSCSCLDKNLCFHIDTDTIISKISDAFLEMDDDVTNVIIRALQAFLQLSPKYCKNENYVDSVGLRLYILQHSLGATVGLLRISSVIRTKSKLPLL